MDVATRSLRDISPEETKRSEEMGEGELGLLVDWATAATHTIARTAERRTRRIREGCDGV